MTTQTTLDIRVERINGTINHIAYPVNEAAKYACMLVKRDFLTQEELVVLQKMGFEIKQI